MTSTMTITDPDELAVATIRTLAMDAVQAANSGHPGTPMALAPVAYTLWQEFLRFDPAQPIWANRDRFVLSVGHASMLLYSLLHLTGVRSVDPKYETLGEPSVSVEDLKRFRQLDSKCPGHPEYRWTAGVECTTGPLGTGYATSVGMAMASKWQAATFNRPGFPLFDYDVYAVGGDGCMMEGVAQEAASLAGHLQLDNLCWIYDNNQITIEGSTSLAFSDDIATKFIGLGWNVIRVGDANDRRRLARAFATFKAEAHRPTLRETWDALYAAYRLHHPDLADHLDRMQLRTLPDGWDTDIPSFPADPKGIAGREANGMVLNAIGAKVPWLVGGSADLAPSTKTLMTFDGAGDFSASDRAGRNLHFGVREHAAGCIANGLALSKVRPYQAGFLIFSDFQRGAIRLSALMEVPVLHLYTHDSIGVGEDGPTHQPVEQIVSLRAIPGLVDIRPADANEVAEAWRVVMPMRHDPVALFLSRQPLPTLDRTRYAPASGLARGAYVLADPQEGRDPKVILIGSGSEVALVVGAYESLTAEGVAARVVSMPSWELFDRQDDDYRESVLPSAVQARVAVEQGSTLGWQRYAPQGAVIGMSTFGASAPLKDLVTKFGFTPEAVLATAKEQIARHSSG
ncbi:MAG: transketolase [Actinomycetales bacterium]|nr:transketolase [Actinomycetales bacterium]